MKDTTYFYLSKKKKGKRKLFYAYFPDLREDGRVITKSVEMLRRKLDIKDHTPITRRQEASTIVQRALDAGLINIDEDDPLFVDYITEFWDFDISVYIQRRNKKNPNSIGKDYAKSMEAVFRRNVVPVLPKNLKLSGIKPSHMELVINTLLDDGILANGTIKRAMQSMAVPLKEAKRVHKIPFNPMDGIEPLSARSKERGILTRGAGQIC